jgi:O-antigen ligase
MKQRIVTRKLASLGTRPDFWLSGLLLWTLLSAGRSLGTPWAAAAATEALRWSAGIGFALALGWSLRQTAMAGQFLVTLVGALALAGILGGDSASHSGLVGPYHDHQLYGSVLLLLLPFSAATALTSQKAPWRWGALAACTAGTLCLFLSQTRSAWIGFAITAAIFGCLWVKRTGYRLPRLQVIVLPAAFLLIGLVSVWLLASPADQRAALTSRAATLTALSQDGSWQSRLETWRGTARLIAAHPALGIGLGRYPGAQWQWTHTGGPLTAAEHPSLSNEAHSFYGQTAAETGLIGLGLYLAALAAFAAQGLRRLRTSRRPLSEQSALRIAALSALAGQSVDAFASPSWQFPEASFFFWAVLGVGIATLRRDEPQAVPARVPYPIRRFGQWALSGSVAVVLAAQVLPFGLLTPVEAYTHLASNTVSNVTISKIPCTSGSGICFSLIAHYSDGDHDVTFDTGGASGLPASFQCTLSPSLVSPCISTFGTGLSANQLTVRTSEIGKPMLISGSFEDISYASTIGVGKATYTRPTSPAIPITP